MPPNSTRTATKSPGGADGQRQPRVEMFSTCLCSPHSLLTASVVGDILQPKMAIWQQQQQQQQQQEDEQQTLCEDVLYDVLRLVDGPTLAVVGCVNSSLRCVSRDEGLWEQLCSKQWPSSTRDLRAKALVAAIGGFRKFYADCSRLISAPEPRLWINRGSPSSGGFDGPQEPEELPDVSPCSSNFASMVDVLFNGQLVFSKFVDGIPRAEDFGGWFLGCPFRLDLVESSDRVNSARLSGWDDEVGEDVETGRKRFGRAWKEIWEGMKLSWILVNKKTKQVANLSSLSPIIGQRHWPRDGDFLLRYGSIVADSFSAPTECCIVLKGRILEFRELKITEISMQLKDVLTGEHLSGRFGLAVLEKAVASSKSQDQELVLCRHRGFLKLQHEIKSQSVRGEKSSDVYAFAIAVVVAVLSMFILLK